MYQVLFSKETTNVFTKLQTNSKDVTLQMEMYDFPLNMALVC